MTDPSPSTPLTQSDLEAGFTRLGLRPGQIVEVHSALSSLGHVAGGAATVVDALMNVVGCRFFKARPVVAIYAEALRTDPWSLYGVEKNARPG